MNYGRLTHTITKPQPRKIRWDAGTCDRCGEETFTRRWAGICRLCEPCIEIANAEIEDDNPTG